MAFIDGVKKVVAFGEKTLPYAKTAVAVVGVAIVAVKAAVSDNTITPDEALNIVIAVAVAAGVYQIPNKPKA